MESEDKSVHISGCWFFFVSILPRVCPPPEMSSIQKILSEFSIQVSAEWKDINYELAFVPKKKLSWLLANVCKKIRTSRIINFLSFSGLCNRTLGLESGDILDTALSASSAFDDHSTGPQNARYGNALKDSCCCNKRTL